MQLYLYVRSARWHAAMLRLPPPCHQLVVLHFPSPHRNRLLLRLLLLLQFRLAGSAHMLCPSVTVTTMLLCFVCLDAPLSAALCRVRRAPGYVASISIVTSSFTSARTVAGALTSDPLGNILLNASTSSSRSIAMCHVDLLAGSSIELLLLLSKGDLPYVCSENTPVTGYPWPRTQKNTVPC